MITSTLPYTHVHTDIWNNMNGILRWLIFGEDGSKLTFFFSLGCIL